MLQVSGRKKAAFSRASRGLEAPNRSLVSPHVCEGRPRCDGLIRSCGSLAGTHPLGEAPKSRFCHPDNSSNSGPVLRGRRASYFCIQQAKEEYWRQELESHYSNPDHPFHDLLKPLEGQMNAQGVDLMKEMLGPLEVVRVIPFAKPSIKRF